MQFHRVWASGSYTGENHRKIKKRGATSRPGLATPDYNTQNRKPRRFLPFSSKLITLIGAHSFIYPFLFHPSPLIALNPENRLHRALRVISRRQNAYLVQNA